MKVITYPLRYIYLKDESGTRLLRRDLFSVVIIGSILSAPFLTTKANFYGQDGFLEKFGAFSGVLTGFYIAALVGIASFVSSLGDLDKPIEVGKVTVRDTSGEDIPLTRRQYVSAMFGYLSFVSMVVSIAAIMAMSVARQISALAGEWLGHIGIVVFSITVSHMIVTTFHGLYYFIDRLYDKEPMPSPKPAKKGAVKKSGPSNDVAG